MVHLVRQDSYQDDSLCGVHMHISAALDNSDLFQGAEVSAKHLPKIIFSKAYDSADPT